MTGASIGCGARFGERLPLGLITKLAKLRAQERRAAAASKRTRPGSRGTSKR
jgi:hypothetical protein